MLTTAVDEMTSKLEKYWKSGEDGEDYYEQDDDKTITGNSTRTATTRGSLP